MVKATKQGLSIRKCNEEYTLQTECSCSKEMFLVLLMSVDTNDLKVSFK